MYDKYSTHQQALVKAMLLSPKGVVVEFGMGYYSTPILHEIAIFQKRILYSFDNDEVWRKQFVHLQTDNHYIIKVDDWDEVYDYVLKYSEIGLVFLDHNFYQRRLTDLDLLKNKASIIVCHDINDKSHFPSDIKNEFKYVNLFDKQEPQTIIVSNFIPVGEINE